MLPSRLAVVASALDSDVRAALSHARRDGFGAIQMDAYGSGLDLVNLSASGRRELRQIIRSHHLELAGLSIDLGGAGFSPSADIDAAIDRLDKSLESAAGLQAALVCVELGPLPTPPPEPKSTSTIAPELAGLILIPPIARPAPQVMNQPTIPAQLDPTFAASVDGALAELGRRADRYGVTVAFRSELAGFAALQRALRAAACPWFGVDLDPVAILRDDWPMDEIFSRFGGMISHVRGRDAIGGAERRTKPAIIGRGSVDWPVLMSRLDEAGFHGWITLDPVELSDRRAAAAAGAANLRALR